MDIWVQARREIAVEDNGSIRKLPAGDWWPMDRQTAQQYLVRDEVVIHDQAMLQAVQDLADCGILIKGTPPAELGTRFPGVPVEDFTRYADYGRFLIWDTEAALQMDKVLIGFKLLEKWQLALPLKDYETLAENIGGEAEREATRAIVHDLRIPVYDSRVMFVRQCEETRRLFDLWDGSQLGLIRALYQARPVYNALLPTWVN